jgi:hypothetical protein
MADFDSSLPISITDFVDPDGTDKQVEVSEKLVHIRAFAKDSDGTKREMRLSQEGALNSDGDYDASNNKKPSSNGQILHDRAATAASPSETSQNKRPTAVEYDDGSSTRVCQDMSLHDESGVPYSQSNPLPVSVSESEGDEIQDYQTTASVLKDSSTDHDYTVSALKTFLGKGFHISASGRVKYEIKLETAAASGTYNTVLVGFTSSANPVAQVELRSILKQVTGAKVRVTITNADQKTMDLYSTLQGIEY